MIYQFHRKNYDKWWLLFPTISKLSKTIKLILISDKINITINVWKALKSADKGGGEGWS